MRWDIEVGLTWDELGLLGDFSYSVMTTPVSQAELESGGLADSCEKLTSVRP